jgi:hypothetical protein
MRMKTNLSNYSFEQHSHRFAAWAASRAASTKTCRFSVALGKTLIEGVASLVESAVDANALPFPDQFDAKHKEWREEICSAAGDLNMTHGTAAKLINVYLKATLFCPHCLEWPKIKAIHPPIDRLLLAELARHKREVWRGQNLVWSKFSSEEYEEVIAKVKATVLSGAGLWTIEEYWPGNQ